MPQPLVSVVCLCYNHAPYVIEALESVLAQHYKNVELIVVDDASTDGSAEVIRQWLQNRPEVQFLPLSENVGNCKAFNLALKKAKGQYVIDLAADDLLLPERVSVGLKAFKKAGETAGVHFTDAHYIDEAGKRIGSHYTRDASGRLAEVVPQGYVYQELLKRYFICTPSMMMRREVFDDLGGYDERLAYEDFDFWVRSARKWQYIFTDQVLVKKRILPNSHSANQYQRFSAQLKSTLVVCRKAYHQHKEEAENEALDQRLGIEYRQAVKHRRWFMAAAFLAFKKRLNIRPWQNRAYALVWSLGSRLLRF